MAELATAPATDEPREPEGRGPGPRSLPRQVARWIGMAVLALVALVVLLIGFLHTPPGRQFIVNQISSYAPASGLSVEVGEIDGSILWSATLFDVRFRDANDELFLEVPEIELSWAPWRFLWSGLDISHLVLANGTLYAAPELIPGDPDAPTLPDFDIEIDRLVIDNLTIAPGMVGGEARVVDFRARTDIRDGLVFVDAEGAFGGGDVFTMLVNAEPDGNRFELDLDYRAPAGGFLAALVGAEEDLALRLAGDGTWQRWDGRFEAVQNGTDLANLTIINRGGRYRIAGDLAPGDYVEGVSAQALGETVALDARGTFVDTVLDGTLTLGGQGIEARAEGAIDLANNEFDQVLVDARLIDENLFGDGFSLTDASIEAILDGPFDGLDVPHQISIGELDAGGTIVRGLTQRGTLTYDGTRFVLPLDASVERIISGNDIADPRLVDGTFAGTLVYSGDRLMADTLAIRFQGLAADLALMADLSRGAVGISGPVRAAGLSLDGIGTLDTTAQIRAAFGGAPWRVSAQLAGSVRRVTNETLANLAGQPIRFAGGVSLGAVAPVAFDNFRINAPLLQLAVDGRVQEGTTTLAGSGRHVEYGPFTVEAEIADDGPRAVLVFADPLPAAGLADVRVALSPTDNGFRIETEGGSLLGPFEGLVDLTIPNDGDITIGIERLLVSETIISGDLALAEGGVAGTLALARGGVDGTLALSTRNGGQAFDADIAFDNARFGGASPIAINSGRLDASGFIGGGSWTVEGSTRIAGLGYGNLFLRRVALEAQVTDGTGRFDGAIAGQRGSRFELLVNGRIAPERIAVALRGEYAGRDITMPRRAVLTSTEDGGWRLARTQLGYGNGYTIVEGRFGGEQPLQGTVSLARMPLSLAAAAGGDLGLGGTISGVIEMREGTGGLPVGSARVKVDNLTRSGLILTSRPIDVALVGELSANLAQVRAIMDDGADTDGRLQARISGLPASGSLGERLAAGDLAAQFRYRGPAASLWRLAAIDLIDITGPLAVAANITGSLDNPRIRGSLAGDSLGVQSALTGTVLNDVRARGRFSGSRLALTGFAGTAPNGGRVNGSGTIDLGTIGAGRGPRIDLRMAARDAEILDLPTMGATVTGPMRIVSNGIGGTIAGRLQVGEARWRLGAADETVELPSVPVREVNLPPDIRPAAAASSPWRYLIDAVAPGDIQVDGLGLDSQWRGEVRLRGTTDAPTIGGEAEIVPRQGFYSFAGSRFEITRGRILFDMESPPNPRIDIVAVSEFDGLEVAVNVDGTALQPEISFTSVPALPEEELLARILFGGSVTDLSATDALQLGSALASLRGGGGLGPINKLRNAIGVDRLRIVPADPALNRGTSVALGKNISRRFYAEVITDGADYSATELEFRVTSWLSLLATISTVGRQSVAAEYSRDY